MWGFGCGIMINVICVAVSFYFSWNAGVLAAAIFAIYIVLVWMARRRLHTFATWYTGTIVSFEDDIISWWARVTDPGNRM